MRELSLQMVRSKPSHTPEFFTSLVFLHSAIAPNKIMGGVIQKDFSIVTALTILVVTLAILLPLPILTIFVIVVIIIFTLITLT